MYRDSRPSVEAKIDTLEVELEVAEQELEVLREQRKPLSLLVFPLFEDFGANIRSLRRRGESAANYLLLAPLFCAALLGLSVAVLPKALVTIGLRAKRGSIRRSKGRIKSLTHELHGTRKTLLELGDGGDGGAEE